jgi:hypothetical protein
VADDGEAFEPLFASLLSCCTKMRLMVVGPDGGCKPSCKCNKGRHGCNSHVLRAMLMFIV